MKRILLTPVLLTIAMFNMACCSKEPIPPKNNPNPCLFDCDDLSKLEVVWTKQINGKDYNSTHLQPFIYNSTIIFGATTEGEGNETIYSFDINTGDMKWKWNDYLSSAGTSNPTRSIGVYNNLGVISYNYRDYVLNLETGSSVWRYETPVGISSMPRGSLIGNWIYHPQDVEGPPSSDSIAHMARTSIENPNWEIVYTLRRDSTGANVNFEPPSLAIATNGDSILIFQNRSYNFVKGGDKQDLIAFNLRTKAVQWKIDDIAKPNASSVHPILIKGNLAIFFGGYTVYAINITNGTIVWTYTGANPDLNSLLDASCIIVDDKLYVKTEGEQMYCLYLNSGIRVWGKAIEWSGQHSNLIYNDGKIYFTVHEKIYCINAANGNVIFRYRSPNANRTDQSGRFQGFGGLAIDPIAKRMYFADSYYMNCVKLPE